jgi:hypothetical protein
MPKSNHILFYIGGAALIYYLYNKNKTAAPLPINQKPGISTPTINTINNLVQSATTTPTPINTDPIVIQSNVKGAPSITATQTSTGLNGAIYTAIVPTIMGPLPVSATQSFLANNKPATISNLAVTNNLLNTGTLLENTTNIGPTVAQLTTKPIANNLTTITKAYL